MNNTLETLNNIEGRKSLKIVLTLKDFPFNDALKIEKCERKLTPYGLRIMLELEHQVVFLPERYSYIPEETIKELCTGQYYIKKVLSNGIYYKFVFDNKK